MYKRSLTLTEFLVVVAIVGSIAAIVQPVFSKARDRTSLETCLDNNRQLGTAFLLYAEDTDRTLPPWIAPHPPPQPFYAQNPTATTWDVAIFAFVRTRKCFTCPAAAYPGPVLTTDADPLRNYAMPANVSGIPIGRLKAPSRTVLLYEKGLYLCGVGSDATGEYFGQTAGSSDPTKTFPNDPIKWGMRHRTGKVFLFADSHAAWFPASKPHVDYTNPFGYYFPNTAIGAAPDGTQYNWPKGASGIGYCGSANGLHAGLPTYPGANLPDQP